ncbi:sugar kinase [Porphyrobacter sp. YT40]|uniref:sugar kinase n=1 Tax=Porphyrobacter sp. YT40 TaxID=2547601 RepID=UPI00114457F6|nr:sugar kinase [Porphyrobacter sp. YT40]QDH35226.1 sugar kinase [Porphyrobacter sp. YT40]
MNAVPILRPGRVVCFGEVLLRLAAPAGELLLQHPRLEPSFAGAEANVAAALAGFGHEAALVTALPDNPLGAAARQTLRGMGVDVVAEAAPGSRLGLYFLQPGAMARPASVTYDRAGSAFALHDPARYDWPALLAGADWLFVGGITAALGDRALGALRDAMAAAQAAGLRIAFDTNFRPSLWQGREAEAAVILRDLAAEADLVFAGRRAAAMMVGGHYGAGDPDAGFRAAAQALFALSPRIRHVAATRREVASAERQTLTGLLADRESVSASATIALEQIVDRVGTGDAFAAGVVHGLLTDMPRGKTIAFATACAQWAHSVPGDFLRASLADIAAMGAGAADVRR